MADFLGMGTIVECLKQEDTTHSSIEVLKIQVKTSASCSMQVFKHEGETPSETGAFLAFSLLNNICTSSVQLLKTGWMGVWWGG